ncbi:hypothetical protein KOW79_021022 [Hemibagrus wyckioides]|uniref:THD domain-containing protein n=1 Tax=Hemibagrus wyckioides TaxID=337641 RepID=A0A9D3N4Z1_9TELE|nr:tumor necrosis factor ligand superfamily member 6 [Hemibagrus wyckioides]KAG7316156.1 hypothetical protein KOW79_021022 [Hemibagrus wyckioides]
MGEVFVVDSQATATPVPPRQRTKGTYVVYSLLGLALCGVFLEGVLIYQLYNRISTQQKPEEFTQHSKQTGENNTWDDSGFNKTPQPITKSETETKTAAFLHLMHPPTSELGVIQWSENGFPAFTHNFSYRNGSLVIQREGFYYLFSKVSFTNNCNTFKHEVKLNSSRYSNVPISLMVDNRHSSLNQMKAHDRNHCSSYLGGVFLLHRKEEVFVSVDKSCLSEGSSENFFGGFMI